MLLLSAPLNCETIVTCPGFLAYLFRLCFLQSITPLSEFFIPSLISISPSPSFPAPSLLWLQILCEERFIAAETEIPEKQLLNQVLDAVKVTPTLHEDLQVEVMKVRVTQLGK